MNQQRFVVTDRVWQRLEPHLPGKASDAGAMAKDNRLFQEAVFRRFRRWAKAGVFESLFNAMSGDPDLEYALIPSQQITA